jgi:hypothetical protein
MGIDDACLRSPQGGRRETSRTPRAAQGGRRRRCVGEGPHPQDGDRRRVLAIAAGRPTRDLTHTTGRPRRPRRRCVGEGPAMIGPVDPLRSVRRPCDRLWSHPRASAGPLLRLADRPAQRGSTTRACDRRRAADARPHAHHGPPKEAAASLRRRGAGDDWSRRPVSFGSPALRSSRVASPRKRGAPAPPRRSPRAAGIDDARLRSPQAADTRHLATADASREAAGGDGGGRRAA